MYAQCGSSWIKNGVDLRRPGRRVAVGGLDHQVREVGQGRRGRDAEDVPRSARDVLPGQGRAVPQVADLLVRRRLNFEQDIGLDKNVRLQAIGRLTDLPDACQQQLHKSIEATAKNTGVTLVLALSYGGRLEIIDGIKSLLRAIELGHIDKGMIDVEMFSKHLYTRYYPDPDLLIRTSGEMRLSNFLLWQLSYTEMYVTPKLWPDFTKKDLYAAVEEYGRRQRRYGGVEVD